MFMQVLHWLLKVYITVKNKWNKYSCYKFFVDTFFKTFGVVYNILVQGLGVFMVCLLA